MIRTSVSARRAARKSLLTSSGTCCSLTAYMQSHCNQGVTIMGAPRLDGIHHLKLPVSDLDKSLDWYTTNLGYELAVNFVEQGVRMGVSMDHPQGGPELALRLNPEQAAASAGFDYFAIGVPGQEA